MLNSSHDTKVHAMHASGDSRQLLEALRSPDGSMREEATRQIFERYFADLWRLVWKNLHPRVRQRVDPDDIINSGIKSLIFDFQKGVASLDGKDNLWALLVQAVLSKARQAHRRHTRQKRSVFREQAPREADSSSDPVWEYLATAEPTPHEALCLQEALELLEDDLRTVAIAKLEGQTDEALAREMGYASTEPIRIKKRLIESTLKDYFAASVDD